VAETGASHGEFALRTLPSETSETRRTVAASPEHETSTCALIFAALLHDHRNVTDVRHGEKYLCSSRSRFQGVNNQQRG
jgi:hypothetical protein